MASKFVNLCRLLLLAGTVILSGGAQACGPYTVAFYEYGSLYFQNVSGQYEGIDQDVIEELGQRTGCRFEGYVDSRARIWAHMREGSLDMSVSGIQTPDREVFAHFIIYAKSRNYLLMRPQLASRVASLAAFSADPALRVAVVRSFRYGAVYDEWLARLRKQGRVDEYSDAERVARVFAKGRADAFLTQPLVWTPILKKHALEGAVQFLDLAPADVFRSGLVLSRTRVAPEDVQRMQAGMDAMRRDGTLLKIFRKHLSEEVSASLLP